MSGAISVSSKEQFDAILQDSRTVVASVFLGSAEGSEQITTTVDSLSEQLSRKKTLTFVKVDNDANTDISSEYKITEFPTFLIFESGKLVEKLQGDDLEGLRTKASRLSGIARLTETIEKHRENSAQNKGSSHAGGATSSSAPGATWRGAELPRGYNDITDQVDIRDCEVLNADDDAGTVRVLFESSKPSALNNGKGTSKDWVQSGSDDQLLLYVPFQSIVKLHTLQITSVPSAEDEGEVSRPGVVHLFINRPHNMDFAEADESEPTQVITLGADDWNSEGTAAVNLRFVKFQKTSSLIVYVQQGDGEADAVRVDRVRLIGEAGAKTDMGKLKQAGDEE